MAKLSLETDRKVNGFSEKNRTGTASLESGSGMIDNNEQQTQSRSDSDQRSSKKNSSSTGSDSKSESIQSQRPSSLYELILQLDENANQAEILKKAISDSRLDDDSLEKQEPNPSNQNQNQEPGSKEERQKKINHLRDSTIFAVKFLNARLRGQSITNLASVKPSDATNSDICDTLQNRKFATIIGWTRERVQNLQQKTKTELKSGQQSKQPTSDNTTNTQQQRSSSQLSTISSTKSGSDPVSRKELQSLCLAIQMACSRLYEVFGAKDSYLGSFLLETLSVLVQDSTITKMWDVSANGEQLRCILGIVKECSHCLPVALEILGRWAENISADASSVWNLASNGYFLILEAIIKDFLLIGSQTTLKDEINLYKEIVSSFIGSGAVSATEFFGSFKRIIIRDVILETTHKISVNGTTSDSRQISKAQQIQKSQSSNSYSLSGIDSNTTSSEDLVGKLKSSQETTVDQQKTNNLFQQSTSGSDWLLSLHDVPLFGGSAQEFVVDKTQGITRLIRSVSINSQQQSQNQQQNPRPISDQILPGWTNVQDGPKNSSTIVINVLDFLEYSENVMNNNTLNSSGKASSDGQLGDKTRIAIENAISAAVYSKIYAVYRNNISECDRLFAILYRWILLIHAALSNLNFYDQQFAQRSLAPNYNSQQILMTLSEWLDLITIFETHLEETRKSDFHESTVQELFLKEIPLFFYLESFERLRRLRAVATDNDSHNNGSFKPSNVTGPKSSDDKSSDVNVLQEGQTSSLGSIDILGHDPVLDNNNGNRMSNLWNREPRQTLEPVGKKVIKNQSQNNSFSSDRNLTTTDSKTSSPTNQNSPNYYMQNVNHNIKDHHSQSDIDSNNKEFQFNPFFRSGARNLYQGKTSGPGKAISVGRVVTSQRFPQNNSKVSGGYSYNNHGDNNNIGSIEIPSQQISQSNSKQSVTGPEIYSRPVLNLTGLSQQGNKSSQTFVNKIIANKSVSLNQQIAQKSQSQTGLNLGTGSIKSTQTVLTNSSTTMHTAQNHAVINTRPHFVQPRNSNNDRIFRQKKLSIETVIDNGPIGLIHVTRDKSSDTLIGSDFYQAQPNIGISNNSNFGHQPVTVPASKLYAYPPTPLSSSAASMENARTVFFKKLNNNFTPDTVARFYSYTEHSLRIRVVIQVLLDNFDGIRERLRGRKMFYDSTTNAVVHLTPLKRDELRTDIENALLDGPFIKMLKHAIDPCFDLKQATEKIRVEAEELLKEKTAITIKLHNAREVATCMVLKTISQFWGDHMIGCRMKKQDSTLNKNNNNDNINVYQYGQSTAFQNAVTVTNSKSNTHDLKKSKSGSDSRSISSSSSNADASSTSKNFMEKPNTTNSTKLNYQNAQVTPQQAKLDEQTTAIVSRFGSKPLNLTNIMQLTTHLQRAYRAFWKPRVFALESLLPVPEKGMDARRKRVVNQQSETRKISNNSVLSQQSQQPQGHDLEFIALLRGLTQSLSYKKRSIPSESGENSESDDISIKFINSDGVSTTVPPEGLMSITPQEPGPVTTVTTSQSQSDGDIQQQFYQTQQQTLQSFLDANLPVIRRLRDGIGGPDSSLQSGFCSASAHYVLTKKQLDLLLCGENSNLVKKSLSKNSQQYTEQSNSSNQSNSISTRTVSSNQRDHESILISAQRLSEAKRPQHIDGSLSSSNAGISLRRLRSKNFGARNDFQYIFDFLTMVILYRGKFLFSDEQGASLERKLTEGFENRVWTLGRNPSEPLL